MITGKKTLFIFIFASITATILAVNGDKEQSSLGKRKSTDSSIQEQQTEKKRKIEGESRSQLTFDEIFNQINSLRQKANSIQNNDKLREELISQIIDTINLLNEDIIIKGATNINFPGELGWTPLILAARYSSNKEIIRALIDNGANVTDKNSDGWTPLMIAAQNNPNKEIIETLINMGANVYDKNNDGWTPLMLAIFNSNPNKEIIETLINIGANVNDKNNNSWTPLMLAAQNNPNKEIIRALIDNGANVNDKDNSGWTPLIIAAQHNPNKEIIETLINMGANVYDKNNDGWTPLMIAARYNSNKEIIKTLIDNGANVTDKNSNGLTPLMLTAFSGNPNKEIIETLINMGANVNDKSNNGWTPLMFAINNKANKEIIETLIKMGADVNHQNKDKLTPLILAIKNGSNKEIIETLINADADVNNLFYNNTTTMAGNYRSYTERSGFYSPLMIAIKSGLKKEIIEILIYGGADVNYQNGNGWTPLMFAINNRSNKEIIETLINAGADVNAKLGEDVTPLIIAMRNNVISHEPPFAAHPLLSNPPFAPQAQPVEPPKPSEEIIEILIDNGAIFETKLLLLHHALKEKFTDLIKYLLQTNQAFEWFKMKDQDNQTPFDIACKDIETFNLFISYYPINWRNAFSASLQSLPNEPKSLRDIILSKIARGLASKISEKDKFRIMKNDKTSLASSNMNIDELIDELEEVSDMNIDELEKIDEHEKEISIKASNLAEKINRMQMKEIKQGYMNKFLVEDIICNTYLDYIRKQLPLEEKLNSDTTPQEVKDQIKNIRDSKICNQRPDQINQLAKDLNNLLNQRFKESVLQNLMIN